MTDSHRAASPGHSADTVDEHGGPVAKRRELLAFLFLSVLIWPFVAVAVVGGYGFLVWMYQLVVGPPGPPAV
ncbi:periplasmic nitrate reductase, NapE protein [Azospirillum sp. A39]|uniref:periplasmic nitrate reductase, NapE protein n=1 Tax=Azospirillum sp. A39 TaxID=3462279 RepID=UPI004045B1B5